MATLDCNGRLHWGAWLESGEVSISQDLAVLLSIPIIAIVSLTKTGATTFRRIFDSSRVRLAMHDHGCYPAAEELLS